MAEFSARRLIAIAALTGALVGGAAGGAIAAGWSNGGDNNAAAGTTGDSASLTTAQVVRTTLINTVQVGGSIGYSGSYSVTLPSGTSTQQVAQAQQAVTQDEQAIATDKQSASEARLASDETKLHDDEATLSSLQAAEVNPDNIYTWLPRVGAVIKEGQTLYSLSTEPVPLLYGAVPAYRAFYVGMSDGPDVGELAHDLIALGHGAGMTESNHYSSATAAAVDRWQKALGLPQTGEILLGEVVFEPGPIRVTAVTASLGASAVGGGASSGSVLTATSTTSIVSVELDVSEEYLVKPGDAVSILLPDGTSTVGGRIETVGNVATCAGGGGVGVGGGAGQNAASPCSSVGSNSSASPTVPVTISLDSVPPEATLDQAPVNVNITTQSAANVLAVPVNALLALAGGGFGVDVLTRSTTHLVGVTPGLYDNSLVQISGPGIKVGTVVQVPFASS